jgi:hypothetical protein
MRPFCSFFTISSKSSVFLKDVSCPVEMKTRIIGPHGSDRDRGKDPGHLESPEVSDTPWVGVSAKNLFSNWSRVLVKPLSFASQVHGMCWMSQVLQEGLKKKKKNPKTPQIPLGNSELRRDIVLLLLLFKVNVKL